MKKFLIEDVQVGVTKGGFACGPISGHVVAEVRVRDQESGKVSWHSLSEVEGVLNFTESDESLYEILMEEDFEDEETWLKVEAGDAGGFENCADFYSDMDENDHCDVDHLLLWKYLVCLVRLDWEETARLKERSIGKCLGDFEIPVCDAEQDYLDEKEEDPEDEEDHGVDEDSKEDGGEEDLPVVDPAYERKLLEDFRAKYVGVRLDSSCFLLEEGDTPAGDYDFDETFQDGDYNEYVCCGGYTLNEDAVVTYIRPMTCRMLLGEDAARCTYVDVSAELGYDMLGDYFDSMM